MSPLSYISVLSYVSIILLINGSLQLCREAPRETFQHNQKNVERLRNMFKDSNKLALESLYELNILKQLKDKFNLHNGATINQNGKPELNSDQITIHRDAKDGESQYHISHAKPSEMAGSIKGSGKEEEVIVIEDGITQRERPHKSDSRQSSLFSTFNLPTNSLGYTNPFLTNLMSTASLPKLPTLPAFPTLPTPALPPPRPPKSSIIGNNGGSMALTNDNVVVVNVLSNNY